MLIKKPPVLIQAGLKRHKRETAYPFLNEQTHKGIKRIYDAGRLLNALLCLGCNSSYKHHLLCFLV
jgi:hypothetical protein